MTSAFPESTPVWDPSASYLVFSGYWVDVPGWTNARFPPFTRKIADIGKWVDEAYQWDWDGVPEDVVENNRLLCTILDEA